MRCKNCGAPCTDIGGGNYECQFCGATFAAYDLMDIKEKAEIEAAKVRAAEEVRAKATIEEAKAKAAIEEARAKVAIEEARAKAGSSTSGADLYDKCIDGVLEISCKGKKSSWNGSGYIISYNGYAITNAHVAADDDGTPVKEMVVRVNRYSIPASVVALADNKAGHGGGPDLAIIKLSRMPSELRAMPLGDFDKVRTGEQIYVIGNSLGRGTCITSGIVSDKNRDGYLMYDCATNPGNSGGPVFNAKGEIIGTHAAGQTTGNGAKAQGMNYAVPVSIVKLFIQRTGIIL